MDAIDRMKSANKKLHTSTPAVNPSTPIMTQAYSPKNSYQSSKPMIVSGAVILDKYAKKKNDQSS